jgi:hypothetical protein
MPTPEYVDKNDPLDHANDPDVKMVTETLTKMVADLMAGKGLVLGLSAVTSIAAGKRLSSKEGAGKYVFQKLLGETLQQHPELIDLAFLGLSEVAKNRIRTLLAVPPIKEAEKA